MKKIFLSNIWLVGILLTAVIARVITSFYLGDQVVDLPGTFDQISYHNLALRVLHGYGFSFGETWWPITPAEAPTAHWSFLYTLYLVGVYTLFGPHPLAARLIQAVITGILHPYLAYRIGNTLFSKTVGLVSAGLTAFYLYFVYYDATLMTEPFFISFVMAGLYLTILIAQSKDVSPSGKPLPKLLRLSILSGLAFGGAVLLRQLILIFIPVLFFWVWWVKRKQNVRTILLSFPISAVIILVMILPFSIYNTVRFGHFVLLNTNSGYAFFWSNHPVYGTHFQSLLASGKYQDLIPVELRTLDEADLDQALLHRGIQFVIDDPVRYVLLSFSRIPAFFMFWPSKDSGFISNISRVASFGVLWPFMIYGIFRSIANQKMTLENRLKSPSFLLILFGLVYCMIHLLSWALIRYRLPVDAIWLIFAGLAFVDLYQWVIARRKVSLKSMT